MLHQTGAVFYQNTASIASYRLPDEAAGNAFSFKNQTRGTFNSFSMSEGSVAAQPTARFRMFSREADINPLPVVTALKALIAIVSPNETRLVNSLTESHYQQLVTVLDGLIDVVGEDEDHILASLMDFIGTLIEHYEDEHVPELSEI